MTDENWDLHGAPEAPPSAVLVELFTTIGSESCAAADAVLSQLDLMREEGTPIFTLGFHVDDRVPPDTGDPFAHESFAERQRTYAAVLDLDGAYTPQMVVGGEREFTGSDGRAAGAAISAALDEPSIPIALAIVAPAEVADVDRTGGGPDTIGVRVAVRNGVPDGADLLVALVQTSLDHPSVVRTLTRLEDDATSVLLDLPDGSAVGDCHAVAFVQDRSTLKVLGATSTATAGR